MKYFLRFIAAGVLLFVLFTTYSSQVGEIGALIATILTIIAGLMFFLPMGMANPPRRHTTLLLTCTGYGTILTLIIHFSADEWTWFLVALILITVGLMYFAIKQNWPDEK